ncbi:MAG: hypothetical protein PUF51_04945, partial [Bifidobacteriaceae bacterium]|nr:hypothetical protein [Bifidobacteriaceae bacterium]
QRAFVQALARIFTDLANQERTSNLYMSGTNRLTHREGAIEDVAPLLDALEEQVVLMHLMGKLSEVAHENAAAGPSGGVGVAIGSETHTPGLLHASVVSSGYGRSSGGDAAQTDGDGQSIASPVAFVGSIGPTHMDYATTIAAVQAVAKYLTEYVAREEGDDEQDSSHGESAPHAQRPADDDGPVVTP